jgi:hypothetical protein
MLPGKKEGDSLTVTRLKKEGNPLTVAMLERW